MPLDLAGAVGPAPARHERRALRRHTAAPEVDGMGRKHTSGSHLTRLDGVTRPFRGLDPAPEQEPAQSPATLSPAALVQRASLLPASLTPGELLQLHPTLGNRTVGRLLQRSAARQPSAATADRTEMTVQPQAIGGPAGDRYEQEADRVARQVMKRFDAQALPAVDRAVPPRAEGGQDPPRMRPAALQVSDGAPRTAILPDVAAAIHQDRGQPLPRSVRGPMERAFGTDFSAVRVHTGGEADRLNRGVQASAFTVGGDIFFSQGAYAPGERCGQAALAHELTHVVQQRGAARAAASTGRPMVLQRLPASARIEGEVGKPKEAEKKSLLYKRVLKALDDYATAVTNPVPSTGLGRTKEGSKLDGLLNEVKTACEQYNLKHHKDARAQRIARLQTEVAEEKQRLLDVMQNTAYDDPNTVRSWQEAIAFQRAGVTPTAAAKVGAGLSPGTGLTILGGGQVAAVYEGTWTDTITGATYTGAYKRETSKVVNDPDTGGQALDAHEQHGGMLGISDKNPNYGARNIAMHRICRLLGLDVIPQTEFALHGDELGYVMTKIAGSTIVKKEQAEISKKLEKTRRDIKATLKKAQQGDERAQLQAKKQGWKKEGKSYFAHASAETPAVTSTAYASGVVQRGMTNLQLIDAICRGTDRNQANYLLEFDATGTVVVGVKGIDNDFAFGTAYLTGEKLKGFMAHCGVPPVVDKQVFEKVMQTDEGAVMQAVSGVLPDAEVKVLGDQYFQVRHVLGLMARNQLIDTWGQQSLQQLQAAGAESSYFMRDYSLLQSMEGGGKTKT